MGGQSGSKEEAPPVSQSQHQTFQTVMTDLRRQQIGKRVILKVDRSSLLQGAFSHFKVKGSELNPLDVKFHTERNEEPCTNLGGPNREFFTLILEEFKSPKLDLFEGPGSYLLPVNNRKALNGDMFYLFGKISVISVISEGPGFPYFPPFLVSYLRGREFEHELSSLYIVNTFLTDYINQICNATSQEDLDRIIGEDEERFMENCGWARTDMVTLSKRMMYVQTLIRWELFDKRRDVYDQLKKGLNVLNFLDLTKDLQDFEHLYMCRSKHKTTADYIRKKLLPEVKRLQPRDKEEEDAKKFTLRCLKDLEDEEAAYLFQFITGLDDLPAQELPVSVEFNRFNRAAELPEAITCVQRLILPLGNKSKIQLYSSFDKALKFGRIGFAEKTSASK
ncbi:uncharacterized protein LOC133182942 [Saccostrea echinata]|uniref:uncharacterized protein LOC133182942 n=1 Tax=Saccostrea echinata TaxID=191078 RepID=UPI002A8312A1|nr:uncharacterized protein LOC133182942 [Saccostrea echinata]XP_061173826.1 uncharacterized protein LOC133182942 [Saccostrea echinata]